MGLAAGNRITGTILDTIAIIIGPASIGRSAIDANSNSRGRLFYICSTAALGCDSGFVAQPPSAVIPLQTKKS